MQHQDENPRKPLKPWVLPLMLGSIGVIVLGVIATYANTTAGALVVLLGLFGIGIVAWQAASSSSR